MHWLYIDRSQGYQLAPPFGASFVLSHENGFIIPSIRILFGHKLSISSCGAGAMAAPSVEGLAEEWDACPAVREYMRVKRTLFAPELRKDSPYCNVACGERNFEVLKPLAMRLRLEDGSIGQMKVPDLMKQTFVRKHFFPGIKFPSVISSVFCLNGAASFMTSTWLLKYDKDQETLRADDHSTSCTQRVEEAGQASKRLHGAHQEETQS